MLVLLVETLFILAISGAFDTYCKCVKPLFVRMIMVLIAPLGSSACMYEEKLKAYGITFLSHICLASLCT